MTRITAPWSTSGRAIARIISGLWESRRAGMEDPRFFHQQANWCYQLAWQSFDLAVAHKLNVKLNVMGNELTAKVRDLRSRHDLAALK